MHIPDGVLSPQVSLATGALALGAVGYSLYRLRDRIAERTIPMTGMMAALIFAGQMVNFPVPFLGAPVSGHLIGGVLAAAVLGPWAGCLAIALVLVVQCLLFADGGILALGANVLNMGVVGAWGGFAVLDVLRRSLGGGFRGTLAGVVAASWLCVMAASALFCLEFWLTLRFDPSPDAAKINMSNVLALMAVFHSVIGIGEAIITGGVVSFVIAHRPDLVTVDAEANGPARRSVAGAGRFIAVGLIAATAVAAFVAPFASQWDDGLVAVSEQEFKARASQESQTFVFADYEVPQPFGDGAPSPLWQRVSVSLAGVTGVFVVMLAAWLFDRGLRRRLKAGGAT
ncbi:MAG: energy-coupling factor ABC transporter permease [Planctomycetaceae bacterium]